MGKEINIISGIIIEQSAPLSLEELATALQLEPDLIIEMIEHHLIQPHGSSKRSYRFDAVCFKRARVAASFYHDLEINLQGIALALDLMDKIERLQQQVELLEKQNR